MRPAGVLAGLALVLLGRAALAGESLPYDTVISMPAVEVRSGPSPRFYPTSRLRQGDRVTVVKAVEDGSWLAIRPPAGSFSWIQDKALKILPGRMATVLIPDSPVRVGSQLVDAPPMVEPVHAGPGDQVGVLDKRLANDDRGAWVPITPLAREVRYIPASAVTPAAPVQNTASASPAATPGFGSSPSSTDAAAPLWQQAEQARHGGNFAEAERLYLQLARQTTDHDLQMRCYNLVNFLRQGNPPPAGSSAMGSAAPGSAGGVGTGTAAPLSAYWPACTPCPAPVPAMSQYTYARESGWQRPSTNPGPLPAPISAGSPPPQWIGPGALRPAGFVLDARETYVLEAPQGYFTYVTPQPGATLAPYLGKRVYLYGAVGYRGDVRTHYMVATQVAPGR